MEAKNNEVDSKIPAELQPYYNEPKNRGNKVARWVARVLALLIIVVAGVVFARWVWHQAHKSDDNTTKNGSSLVTTKDTAPQSSSSKTKQGSSSTSTGDEQNNSTTKPSSSSSTSSTSSSSAASSSTSSSTSLSDTGPGDTIAIFVAVTAGGILFNEIRLRSQND